MRGKRISYQEACRSLAERDPHVGVILSEINDIIERLIKGNKIMQLKMDRLESIISRIEIKMDGLNKGRRLEGNT
jgi:hypothetical protein